MNNIYKFANCIRRIYWYIFRPETKGVKCLIECDGEYLLMQTSYSGKYWTLPGGGVRKSETPVQAVRREVKEELDISLNTVSQIGEYKSTAEYKKDTVYLFYTKVSKRRYIKNKSEVSNAKWFSKANLPIEQSRALRESINQL